eukprot:Skav206815  [mRNA]  locus=scaffold4354:72105:79633:+ [translate_table: standard]
MSLSQYQLSLCCAPLCSVPRANSAMPNVRAVGPGAKIEDLPLLNAPELEEKVEVEEKLPDGFQSPPSSCSSSMVVDGTAQLLHLERPMLRRHPGAPLPEIGDEARILSLVSQPPVRAKVYGVDTISIPPRARVMRTLDFLVSGMDTGEEVLVDIVEDADGTPRRQPMSWVVEEIDRAVGEVREKGWQPPTDSDDDPEEVRRRHEPDEEGKFWDRILGVDGWTWT